MSNKYVIPHTNRRKPVTDNKKTSRTTAADRLLQLQKDISVPKERTNNFAATPFTFRNAEDILKAARKSMPPRCLITLSDVVVEIAGRHYVQATAVFHTPFGEINTTGLAREALERKSFDSSQLTGSASSYARKSALCGLLGLDDGMDSDMTNYGDGDASEPSEASPTISDVEWSKCVERMTTSMGAEWSKKAIAYFSQKYAGGKMPVDVSAEVDKYIYKAKQKQQQAS